MAAVTATLSRVARRAIERSSTAASLRDAALAAHPPPAELAYLSSRIGAAATLALIEAHGGTRLHIPKSAPPTARLTRLLGPEAAHALSAWRGGEDVKIPLAKGWRIRVHRAEGLGYGAIARRLGIGEAMVHKHLQVARMTDQADLFG